MTRRLLARLPWPDASDACLLVGLALVAVTVYWLVPLWLPAFLGVAAMAWGVLLALGQAAPPGRPPRSQGHDGRPPQNIYVEK